MPITLSDADSGAAQAAAAGQDHPELRKALEEIVDSGFVGVSLRVHDERGEWVGSAGAAELGGTAKPPTNGQVRIGSNTKTFTATLMLQLVAEGKVGLDTAVNGYLPEFGLDERITVRMLLRHTSGVFNFSGEVCDDGTFAPGIPIPYGTTGKEWMDNRFKTYRPQELVEVALSKPARFEPGTGWRYSNTNYVLARLLIEKVTGCSAKALVPEGFDDYLTHFEHALEDTQLVALTKRAAEAATWEPDDPRIAELATAAADHYLANPALLKTVTGLQARTEAATRYTLVAHHGEEQTPAAARLIALFETKLRAAGIYIPRPDSQ
jgi:hypothetical protein